MKLVVLLFLIPPCWNYHGDDDWIDPTDMLNYDAVSGRMRNRPQGSAQVDTIKDANLGAVQTVCPSEAKEYVQNLKMQIEEYKMKETERLSQSNSNPIFRRHLYRIVDAVERLGLPDESQPEVHYDAEVLLTKHMLAEIQKFLSNADWTVGALDDALSKTLVDFKPHNKENWVWKFEDYFGLDASTIFMIVLSLLCIVSIIATEVWTHIGWFTQLKRICIICIVISFVWNWLYLYKVAFAERQAELAKMDNFDSSCSEKASWSEGLVDWLKSSVTFRNDPCEEYFKALMVNPALMVPPTKALALTFTDFVTEPLKHIGKGIGEFMRALLSEIPLLFQVPVLIFLAFALLAFCYGTGTSIGRFNRVQYLPGPDGNRHLPVEHHRPNPPPAVEELHPEHHHREYVDYPQLRENNWNHITHLQGAAPVDTVRQRVIEKVSIEESVKSLNPTTESGIGKSARSDGRDIVDTSSSLVFAAKEESSAAEEDITRKYSSSDMGLKPLGHDFDDKSARSIEDITASESTAGVSGDS
ncbi:chloride channel CLIC-like protein 1 [Pelodytes ibericus]